MAGVKGRSGGPRKNAGGKRKGAGRPKKKAPKRRARKPLPEFTPEQEAALGAMLPPGPDAPPDAPPDADASDAVPDPTSDAKAFLEGVIAGTRWATADQIRAAQALLPFQHRKLGETGKKDAQKEAAKQVAGRFAPAAPPRLATIAGKRV